jgi:hypothetical protein
MRTTLTVVVALWSVVGIAADVIDLDEVTAGMTGICVTEMDGGEVVEIPLTVLGVLGPAAPEREIVLVRLDSERFETTGIIAGMSGSPVYLEGRLLGALAFGWSFSKQPIGGVTPFRRMLELAGEQSVSVGGAPDRPSLTELVSASREGSLGDLLMDWLAPPPAGELQRLPLAVSLGGWWNPTGSDWLAESWRRLGWVGVPGGAASGEAPPVPLRGGSMVAAVMVEGDATVAAGGTVTEVRGDQLWAFGHPYLGAGGIEVPLARSRVLAVLPNQAVSFKFFEVGEAIGALRADRSHGVWGRIGASAPMVPVEVVVDGHRYSFRSLRHPLMFPLMTAYLVQASLSARGRTLGNQTVELSLETHYVGHPPVVYQEAFASDQASVEAAAMSAAVVAYLENSPFEVPDVERVAIRVDSIERLEQSVLVDAVPERLVVNPGQTLGVRVRLRPHRGPLLSRRLEIRIPTEVPEGRLDLVVADGASWSAYDFQMRPLRPASFDDELRLVSRLVPSRRVVMALERREPGVALSGGSLAVPPSLVVQMRSGLGPNLQTTDYGVVGRIEEDMPSAVVGAQRIPLTVRLDEWGDS